METAFAPLVDFKPKYDSSTTYTSPVPKRQELPISSVIPKDLQPDSVESRLKAEGSGTSTLSTITAWLGAAKGDYRGLQAIEDSKRRTALAKSIVPEMTRVNKLVQSGKWEEASEYVNELAGSYGTRADYLVPYFQQMQADIKKKQEGWNNLRAIRNALIEGGVTEDSPKGGILKALNAAVEKRDIWSETSLQAFIAGNSPHVQNIDGSIDITDLMTGKTKRDIKTQVYKAADLDTYTGVKAAAEAGITVKQLADSMNGLPIKTADGRTLEANSKEAQAVKARYIAMQPLEAREKLIKGLALEPALTAQLLTTHTPEEVYFRDFGKSGIEGALTGQAGRITTQKVAEQEGIMASDPAALQRMGRVAVDFDPSSPNYLREMNEPVTINSIKASGGKIGAPRLEVMDKEVKPALNGIESLKLIPQMLGEGNTPQTKGDRLEAGLNQVISSLIGYPVTGDVEIRQAAKAILNSAVESVENVSGHNRQDIKDLKQYLSGDFKTTNELITAVERVRNRLGQVIERAINVPLPNSSEAQTSTSAKGPTVADRHNNPLNIKRGPATEYLVKEGVATEGEAAKDKGNFLKFENPQQGLQAAVRLLTGPVYNKHTVDAALKKWSNNGYGGEIGETIGIPGTTLIKDLSPNQLTQLTNAMAKAEGGINATAKPKSPMQAVADIIPAKTPVQQLAPVIEAGKPTTMPTLGQPAPEAAMSPEERARAAMAKRKLQRIR